MPFTTLSGLSIKVPTRGTKNWDSVMLTDTFQKIAAHQHTGGGDGNQIITGSIADNAVSGQKIRLGNAEWLRGRNAANTSDINILRVKSDDSIEFTGTVTGGGFVSPDEPLAAISVTASETLTYSNLIISGLLTFTIPVNASFVGLHTLTVNGTFTVEGTAVVL